LSKLRVHCFAVSLDGYGAGPEQSLDHPLGIGGVALHEWAVATQTFRKMFGSEGGTTGIDDEFAAPGMDNIGAWILGRNMFGPVRGPWPDEYRSPASGVSGPAACHDSTPAMPGKQVMIATRFERPAPRSPPRR
jgi:dihydrofolate reductase